jgi:hypothetical protein
VWRREQPGEVILNFVRSIGQVAVKEIFPISIEDGFLGLRRRGHGVGAALV